MFIWDFVAETVLGQIVDWIYSQIVGFLGDFFMQMGNMGADLFEMTWVQSIVLFFSYLAWALYATGLVVAAFECGIEYQTGRGSVRETALNAIKGFMAVSLFTVVPVELYKLCISLQGSFTAGITGLGEDFGTVASGIITSLQDAGTWEQAASAGILGGLHTITSPLLMIFILVLMGYAIIKVFFSNLKRGGILLIQIAVGSLYMFSVPRGYIDGFVGWCKQVIGLCLTAFLQATVLIAGLMVVKDHALLGLGLMLSAGDIPRIAGQFGLDTTTRANVMGAVYAAQGAVNLTRTVVQAVAK
uniref:conjugal transfer protein TrbL family protein n=1 Tax=Enterocloster clostridioformis TaxID=1531 RepID=UPI0026ED8D7E|nr:conjugal transfer protein TrbL family protein [Enterocloster clostridioformis]